MGSLAVGTLDFFLWFSPLSGEIPFIVYLVDLFILWISPLSAWVSVWSPQHSRVALTTSGLWKYFDAKDPSSVIPPDTKPSEKDLWIAKNTTLIFNIQLMMDPSFHHVIVGCTTASTTWNKICESFSTLGPMHQVSLLKHALSTCFSPGIDIDITLLALEHAMKDMFTASPIKEDDWIIIISLNALSHDSFTPIHKQLESILTSTKDGITFDGLKAHLWFEASKVCHADQAIASGEALVVIATKKPSSRVTCSNCNKPGYTKDKCWHPGGSDEGVVHMLMQRKRRILLLLPRQMLWGSVRGWPVFRSKSILEFFQLQPRTPSAFFRLWLPPSFGDALEYFLFQAPSSNPQHYHAHLPPWPLAWYPIQRRLWDLLLWR